MTTRDLEAMPPLTRLWLPMLACGAFIAWLVAFPVLQLPLALGGLALVACVAWRPVALFTLVPALMTVLDLAPWSGRWLIDEYDALLLLGCSVAWAWVPPAPEARRIGTPGTTLAIGCVLLALLCAIARALWPLPDWTADTLSNPLSPLNALRIGKGAMWAWLLWLLAKRMSGHGFDVVGAFGRGMVLGLAGTVIIVIMERLAFSYLLDFSSDYRVSGPIAAMSLGGAYIECFIAVATPFLLARLLPPVQHLQLGAGAVLLTGASYSLMVTFSRGGYGAMALGALVLVSAVLLSPSRRWRRVIAGVAMTALAAAVSYPILTGSFAQQRLETVSADLGAREQHWAQSLRVMDPDISSVLFGMGLGRFSDLNFWRSPEGERAGGHRLVVDEGRSVLRLGSGYAYFVDQIVPVRPGVRYKLTYRMRASGPGPSVRVGVCQKWIIASFECSSAEPEHNIAGTTPAPVGTWETVTRSLVAPGAGPGRLPRLVRLTVMNEGRHPADVSFVSLTSADGTELLRNGDFSAGMDHWTLTSDNHLAWHTKSLPLGIYVEQGLAGLVSMTALLLVGAMLAARAARTGRVDGAALLAALCAFTTVGLIDTLVDVPRFMMLWLLLCLLPSVIDSRAAHTPTIKPGSGRQRTPAARTS